MDGEVLDIRYFFRFLYPPARLLSLLKRKRSVRIRAPEGLMIPVHHCLSLLGLLDYLLLPRALPGTSLLCSVRLKERVEE
jgi:hypothetical protein